MCEKKRYSVAAQAARRPIQICNAWSAVSVSSQRERIVASPLARRTAMENGIALSDVQGTGPGGRIIYADITKTLSSGRTAQSDDGCESPRKL
tara:strand:- start:2338 stop:2616 length:279 start_codon:yes stop_codon:yes gene_type:complete